LRPESAQPTDLKFAGVDQDHLTQVRESLKVEDVERAFGWNLESKLLSVTSSLS
jgi:hypothetical protein